MTSHGFVRQSKRALTDKMHKHIGKIGSSGIGLAEAVRRGLILPYWTRLRVARLSRVACPATPHTDAPTQTGL